MALSAGTRFGVYEIVSILGAGGMGEVYRARDTRLNREVALKILPDAFAADPERMARFTREAQTLAALNHPHIAQIYGLEEVSGMRALVMELVEGQDLAARIAQGAIPVDEALPIARQIAEALEAAHEQSIIHRDLKPANIKVRPDGTVKVLDFGLAKAIEPARSHEATQSPTITSPAMTQAGMILGTAAYMSPEQAKGKPLDRRTDVWAFGCVVFEMVSGTRAFKGEDVAECLAAVLKTEPDWHALPPGLPVLIRKLIVGCLLKDPQQRVDRLSTALFLFSETESTLSTPPRRLRTHGVWKYSTVALTAAVLGISVVSFELWSRTPPALQVTRFSLPLGVNQSIAGNRRAVAISPDGSRIVYSADLSLFLRGLSEFQPRPIPEASPGSSPSFSPDGQSLVFYTDQTLKRVGVDGGAPVTLCRVPQAPASLSWSESGILFSYGSEVLRVSENGGTPEPLLDLRDSDDLAFDPQLLPDGETLLLGLVSRRNVGPGQWENSRVVAHSLRTGERTVVVPRGGNAQYVPTGHIVYVSEGTLFAVPFDASKRAVRGAAVPVVEGVRTGATVGIGSWAHYAISTSGSLVYIAGVRQGNQNLMLVSGESTEVLKLPAAAYEHPRVSPDNRRIAFGSTIGGETAISIYDLDGTTGSRRITFNGNNRFPVWSGDSTRLAFQSDRDGDHAIFHQGLEGGAAVRLTHPKSGTVEVPEAWSPDSPTLLYSATDGLISSLWSVDTDKGAVFPFGDVTGSSIPTDAAISPDGKWVAYQVRRGRLNEGSEGMTYVQPFPPTGRIDEIGLGGRPAWSPDSKRLFLVPGVGRLLVADVTASGFTTPRSVPRPFGAATPGEPRPFDILRDGRFLVVGLPPERTVDSTSGAPIRVVVNWFEELKRLAPVK